MNNPRPLAPAATPCIQRRPNRRPQGQLLLRLLLGSALLTALGLFGFADPGAESAQFVTDAPCEPLTTETRSSIPSAEAPCPLRASPCPRGLVRHHGAIVAATV